MIVMPCPIWCIYCAEMPERMVLSRRHFEERGLEANYWRGVHGKTWGLLPSLPGHRLTSGGIGTCLSHWTLWQYLLLSAAEATLIVEDDVFLAQDFGMQFAALWLALPKDWQFVYVGYLDRPELPRRHVAEGVIDLRYPFGTFAYLVRGSALPVLREGCAQGLEPIDIQLWKPLRQLRVYAAETSLAEDRTQMRGEFSSSQTN